MWKCLFSLWLWWVSSESKQLQGCVSESRDWQFLCAFLWSTKVQFQSMCLFSILLRILWSTVKLLNTVLYWGELWATGSAYCADYEWKKERNEQKNRHYLSFVSPVCFSSNMSTLLSDNEAIKRQDILGVSCLCTAKDKRRSVWILPANSPLLPKPVNS